MLLLFNIHTGMRNASAPSRYVSSMQARHISTVQNLPTFGVARYHKKSSIWSQASRCESTTHKFCPGFLKVLEIGKNRVIESTPQVLSQFVLDMAAAQVRHGHDLDDQTRPPSEVLSALALAGLRVVLLPCEACRLPALENSVDKVLAQSGVEVLGFGLVGSRLGCDIL